ncbi:MAG: hypothetical protein D6785_15300, partial [Planctomycetota bacterium]
YLSLLLFYLPMSLIGHKEGRYLIPILPFTYLLIIQTLQRIHLWLQKKKKGFFSFVTKTTALVIFILFTTLPLIKEWITLQDPIYHSHLISKVVKTLQNLDKKSFSSSHYYWDKTFYCLRPKDYPNWYHFTPYCEFYHFYHLFYYHLEIWGAKRFERFQDAPFRIFYHQNFYLLDPLKVLNLPAFVVYGTPKNEFSFSLLPWQYPLEIGHLKEENLRRKKDLVLESSSFRIRVRGAKGILEKGIFPFHLYQRKREKNIYLGMIISPSERILLKGRNPIEEKNRFSSWLAEGGKFFIVHQKTYKFYRP